MINLRCVNHCDNYKPCCGYKRFNSNRAAEPLEGVHLGGACLHPDGHPDARRAKREAWGKALQAHNQPRRLC